MRQVVESGALVERAVGQGKRFHLLEAFMGGLGYGMIWVVREDLRLEDCNGILVI